MTATYEAQRFEDETRLNIKTGVEIVLQNMASDAAHNAADAARLRDTLFDAEYRSILAENMILITDIRNQAEEVRDQMDALLKVLKGGR